MCLAGVSTGIAFGVIREREAKAEYRPSTCIMKGCRSGNQTCSRSDSYSCGEYCVRIEITYFPCTFVEYVIGYENLTLGNYFTFTPPNITYNCTQQLPAQYSCFVSKVDIVTNIANVGAGWGGLTGSMSFLALCAVIAVIMSITWVVSECYKRGAALQRNQV